jgi:hypothetical protein
MGKKFRRGGGGGGGNNNNNHNNGGNNRGSNGGNNRGGHGGNNRGGHGGNHGNNNNNGGNKKKYCKNCGENNSHVTADCRKKQGPNNQNNKVNKNNNYNNNNNNKNNKNNGRTICGRCGFNHEERYCNAKEVDEDERCPCGNIYHRAVNCPWNQDPLERVEELDKGKGMICIWCKRDGDGMHEFADCKEVVKFRAALKERILSEYRGLQWCWHCSAENHLTAACTKPVADIGKTEWFSKINRIIQDWTEKDLSIVGVHGDSDMPDVYHPSSYFTAPHPADYKWCVYCQDFGDHFGNRSTCDTSEFDRRTPSRFKGLEPKRPYVPVREDNPWKTTSWNTSLQRSYNSPDFYVGSVADLPSGVIQVRCTLKPNCHQILRFRKDADPKGNDRNFCTSCREWMRHPYQTDKAIADGSTTLEILKTVKEMFELNSDGKKDLKQFKKHRGPSCALPKELAVDLWPEEQPKYDDLGTVPEWETEDRTLFKRSATSGEIWFNKPGNFQNYFPPILIKLTKQDIAIRDDHTMPINRAGYLNQVLTCLQCGTVGVVRDAEGDLVMTGVDSSCTVGCGYGVPEWSGTYHKDKCKCLTILGKNSMPQFIAV